MPELWLVNPREVRPRVRVRKGAFTLRPHSPWKGRVTRVNPVEGGQLMSYLANPRRRARYRRNDPGPKRRKRRARVRRGSSVRVRHVLNPRRRRRSGARGGFLSGGAGGFLNMNMLTNTGFAIFGMVTPGLVTDRLLPMFGYTPTGWIRRGIQIAVPTAVLFLGGRQFLGRGAGAFAVGAYSITALGIYSDVTGGATMLANPRVRRTVGRFELAPRNIGTVGAFERAPRRLGQNGSMDNLTDGAETLYAY